MIDQYSFDDSSEEDSSESSSFSNPLWQPGADDLDPNELIEWDREFMKRALGLAVQAMEEGVGSVKK